MPDPAADWQSTMLEMLCDHMGSKVAFAGQPYELTGGRSARLYGFRLTPSVPPFDGDLVVRFTAQSSDPLCEATIQRLVAEQGFPTPRVMLAERDIGNGRGCIVMAKTDGTPPFEGGGPQVIRAFRDLPALLGRLMADLHSLDAAEVETELAARAVDTTWMGSDAVLDDVDRLVTSGDVQLDDVVGWLRTRRPDAGPVAVCHGDLHALNLLVDGSEVTVIDWEMAMIASPAFDVARTSLILATVPVDMPRVIRPLVQRLGRRSAATFEREYGNRRSIDEHDLRWHKVLHATRLEAMLAARGTSSISVDSRVLDGWEPTRPSLRHQIGTLTGITIG